MVEKYMTSRGADLDLLFRPRSLAVIGVSQDFSKGGGFLWSRVQEHGFQGKKYPVSRSCDQIDGCKCYRSVSDIEEPIDLAIAAVPAGAMESVIADCARKSIRFTVIHAAGFAESGEKGRELQERLFKIARTGGMRLVGPNCMGVFCPDVSLNTIMEVDGGEFKPGGISFSGQSGWAAENFVLSGTARGLRLNTVISSGNQADLDLFDYVSYFGSDPKTRVICVYTEGIARGREFLDLALEVGSEKPIIIWRSGFSRAGARAVISHTGSIAGNREIWQGAARSAGIIIAEGLEELLDMAAAFSSPVLPKGRKVGIISEAGGGGISAADSCENQGLQVRPFSPKLRETLKGMLQKYLPPFSGTSNPLDLVWLPKEVAMTTSIKCIELVASEVDSVIFMSYLPFLLPDLIPKYIEAICRIRDDLSLPIFVVPPFGIPGAAAIKQYTSAGLPSFSSFERVAKAISVTYGYQEWVSS